MVTPKKNALQVYERLAFNIYIDLLEGKPTILGGMMVVYQWEFSLVIMGSKSNGYRLKKKINKNPRRP